MKQLCIALLLAVGCSPTQTAWNLRARDGMTKDATNLNHFYTLARAKIDLDQKAFEARVIADAKVALLGKAGTTTQPVTFNAAYLDDLLDIITKVTHT